jgi:hypothetical protein
MDSSQKKAQQERVYGRLFHESFKRLKKRGLREHAAGQIARRVAEETLERVKAPVFRTDQEYSDAIGAICRRLGSGMSHYALTGEMPYLIGGRLDRVAAIAKRVEPPIEAGAIQEAKKMGRVERLSAGVALFFTGLALGTLGLWYAIAVGIVVAAGAEIYFQTQMPVSLRRSAGRRQVPLLVNLAAAASLVYFGYRWIEGDRPRGWFVLIAAVALFVIAFVIPGLTLARLVNVREKKWRKALEEKLLQEAADQGEAPEEQGLPDGQE